MQTNLPHFQMPCPEVHYPWWLNHRLKSPPADSEPCLKSICCYQPWQWIKGGIKQSKLSKVTKDRQKNTEVDKKKQDQESELSKRMDTTQHGCKYGPTSKIVQKIYTCF